MEFREAVAAVKSRLSILDIASRYAAVKRMGSRFFAPCPFHSETKPSLHIDDDKGLFHCFGCGASGDVIEFYSRINGLDFNEAFAELAREAGVDISNLERSRSDETPIVTRSEKQEIIDIQTAAAKHFTGSLISPEGEECRAYLERRGIGAEIIERFGLGWARRDWRSLLEALKKDGFSEDAAEAAGLIGKSDIGKAYDRFRGRLIFPIFDLSGRIIGFGGRIIGNEDEAKYINSPDTPVYHKKENLYGLAQARKEISAKGSAFLTEGYIDVLTMHQSGYANCVAALGTALTEEQIKKLSGFTSKMELIFDGDDPGRKAAFRACSMILARGLSCSVVLLPDGEDIDSLLRDRGAEEFEDLRRGAPGGLDFCISVLRDMAPKDAVEWVKEFLEKLQIPELSAMYGDRLAHGLGLAPGAFRLHRFNPSAPVHEDSSIRKLLIERDTHIIMYAVRYPHRLEDLRDMGADLALSCERSREFWNLIERYAPEEIVYHLDERQRSFWDGQRGPFSPPPGNGDAELLCLRDRLDIYYGREFLKSLSEGLVREKTEEDFRANNDWLKVIEEHTCGVDSQFACAQTRHSASEAGGVDRIASSENGARPALPCAPASSAATGQCGESNGSDGVYAGAEIPFSGHESAQWQSGLAPVKSADCCAA